MEGILKLEKEINKDLKDFILGKNEKADFLKNKIASFFKNKTQKDIEKLKPLSIRLFASALEILEHYEGLEIEKANLDYIRSYKHKPLKYRWKCSQFGDMNGFLKVLRKILSKKEFPFSKEFIKFCLEVIKNKWWFENYGILDKDKKIFIYAYFNNFEDENKPKVDLLIITNKENNEILEILPNDEGVYFSNLVFRKCFNA